MQQSAVFAQDSSIIFNLFTACMNKCFFLRKTKQALRVITVISAAILLSCSSGEIHLRFQYKEGSAVCYKAVTSVSAAVTDSMGVKYYTSSAKTRLCNYYNKVYPNGDAKCELTVDSISYTNNSLDSFETNNIIKTLLESVFKARLSPYGDFLDIEEPENQEKLDVTVDVYRMLLKIFPILPHSGVKVGDAWDRQQQIPVDNSLSHGTLYLQKRFKFIGIENVKNRLCAKMSVTVRMSMGLKDGDPFQVSAQNDFIGKGNGTLYFDIQEGLYVDGTANISAKLKASIIDPQTGTKTEYPVEIKQNLHVSILSGNK